MNTDHFAAQSWREVPRVGSRLVDARVEEAEERGVDFVRLLPYPTVRLPPHVLGAVTEAAAAPVNAPARGLLEFREAVADELGAEWGTRPDPARRILATSGGMHALWLAIVSLLNPGEEVLIPSPCYFMEGILAAAGARPVYVEMDQRQGYAWDWERLESAVTPRTRMMFINNPVNPTGCVLTRPELDRVAEIAERHDLLLLADESYDTLVYDGHRHASISGVAEVRDRVLLIRSFTKSFAMPAWRVGYIAAHAEFIERCLKTLEWMVLYGSSISQVAATAALRGDRGWIAHVAQEFERNRDLLATGIHRLAGWSCRLPAGGPFVFPQLPDRLADAEHACRVLLDSFGVPAVPGDYFHGPGHLRLAFGGEPSALVEALRRLEDFTLQARGTDAGPHRMGIRV